MFRIFFFIAFVSVFFVAESQQVLLYEDFEGTTGGALPNGWTKQQEQGADGWETGNNLASGYFDVPSHSVYAASNDDACNCNSLCNMLITPPLDLSDTTFYLLKFDRYFTKRYGDDLYVKVSLDGGSSWQVIKTVKPCEDWTEEYVSLNDFAGNSNVLIAFCYSDNNYWASGAAVDNVTVFVPSVSDFHLFSGIYYSFVCPGDSIDVNPFFVNLSSQVVSSFKMDFYVNGTYNGSIESSQQLSLLDTVTVTKKIFIPSSGIYDVSVVLSSVNGSSVNVDTVNFRFFALNECKNTSVLVEENTGTWCSYCPEGDYFLDSLAGLYPSKVKPVSIHYSDVMSFAGGNNIIGSYFYTYPSVMINRWLFNDSWYVSLKNKYTWRQKTETVLQRKTPFRISVSSEYDEANGYYSTTLHISPLGDIIGDFSVNLFLTEDSIMHSGDGNYWQLSAFNNVTGSPFYGKGDTIKDYVFNHVLRYVAGGTWGYSGFLPDTMHYGDQYDVDFLVLMQDGWVAENMNAIAVVEFTGENSVYDRYVVAVQSQGLLVGNDEIKLNKGLAVYPNPASDVIYFSGDFSATRLLLYNVTGNLVKVVNKPVKTVYVGDLPQGVYFLKLIDLNGNFCVKKIVKK